jgi:hypothetical protein
VHFRGVLAPRELTANFQCDQRPITLRPAVSFVATKVCNGICEHASGILLRVGYGIQAVAAVAGAGSKVSRELEGHSTVAPKVTKC